MELLELIPATASYFLHYQLFFISRSSYFINNNLIHQIQCPNCFQTKVTQRRWIERACRLPIKEGLFDKEKIFFLNEFINYHFLHLSSYYKIFHFTTFSLRPTALVSRLRLQPRVKFNKSDLIGFHR